MLLTFYGYLSYRLTLRVLSGFQCQSFKKTKENHLKYVTTANVKCVINRCEE
jgi:hypothetical protein